LVAPEGRTGEEHPDFSRDLISLDGESPELSNVILLSSAVSLHTCYEKSPRAMAAARTHAPPRVGPLSHGSPAAGAGSRRGRPAGRAQSRRDGQCPISVSISGPHRRFKNRGGSRRRRRRTCAPSEITTVNRGSLRPERRRPNSPSGRWEGGGGEEEMKGRPRWMRETDDDFVSLRTINGQTLPQRECTSPLGWGWAPSRR
jgi:hypothetical protein